MIPATMRNAFRLTVALGAVLSLGACHGFFVDPPPSDSDLTPGTTKVARAVYVANAPTGAAGSVNAYTVSSDTSLAASTGSPFATNDVGARWLSSNPGRARLYAASHGGAGAGAVDIFTIGAGGGLTAASAPAAVSNALNPTALAATASSVYAAYDTPASIVRFVVQSDGQLLPDPTTYSIGAVSGGASMEIDPTGTFLYTTNGSSVHIFKINSDGTLVFKGTTDQDGARQIVIDSNTQRAYLAATAGIVVYNVNKSSDGTLVSVGTPVSLGAAATGVAVDPTRTWLYAIASGKNQIFGFKIEENGSLKATPTASFSTGTTPTSIAISPSGRAVYVTNAGDNTMGVYTIKKDGTLNRVSTVNTGANPQKVIVIE